MGTKSRETMFGLPSAPRLSEPPLAARKPTALPAKRGTSACSAIAARRNPRPRSAMPSMPAISISKWVPWLRHAPDRGPRHRAATRVATAIGGVGAGCLLRRNPVSPVGLIHLNSPREASLQYPVSMTSYPIAISSKEKRRALWSD